MDHVGEPAPVSVQIAGTVPEAMAEAARHNVDHGAQIIDINMGCPAKKVCNAWAGSALMRDEALVARILAAVVRAVEVPVTLKIRTGWDREVRDILLGHLQALHAFYGEPAGVRIARKHLGWYAKDRADNADFRAVVNRAETAEAQLRLTRDYFDAPIAGVAPELPVAA